jgi:hypothetical protein
MTIEEGVVSMLHESGMPTAFWGKALTTFIHTSNRLFTSALPDMIHIKPSMGASQISPCFEFGAALLMCSSRETATTWEPWDRDGEVCLHWIPSGLQGLEVLQPCDQEGGHF